MPRAKIETAFLGHYTLAILDECDYPDAGVLIRAIAAWILRDELADEADLPAHLRVLWRIIRDESETIHEARKQQKEAGRVGGLAKGKRKESERQAKGKRKETKIEIEIERESSLASARDARARETIPPALVKDEAAWSSFWNVYPRRDYPMKARSAWNDVFGGRAPAPEVLTAILAAVETAKASDGWREEGGRFIPTAEKWLHNRQWEVRNDTLPPPAPRRRANETNLTAIHSGNPQYANLPV